MRPLAFLVTATCFAAVFLGIVVVALTANVREPVQPQFSILAN